VLAKLFTCLVQDALSEYAYAAEVANLSYDLSSDREGLTFQLYGYNHKMPILMDKVLETVKHLTVDAARFHTQREQVEQDYANFFLHQPYQLAVDKFDRATQVGMFRREEFLECSKTVTAEDLTAWIPGLLSKGYLKAFVHGNMSPDDTLAMVERAVDILALAPLSAEELAGLKRSTVVLPEAPSEGRLHFNAKNPEEQNSATIQYFQIGRSDLKEMALLRLFALHISNPCFEELRTKQQLGYIVFSGNQTANHVSAMRFIVQSDSVPPEEVHRRIDAFLDQYRSQDLANLSDEEFETTRNGLLTKLTQKDQSLEAECNRHWGNIDAGNPLNQRELIVGAVRELSKEDLTSFFDRFFGKETRRCFMVAAHGSRHSVTKDEASVLYVDSDNLNEFKKDLALYPNTSPLC